MRFSVVVATFNRKQLLRKCLREILEQTLPAYEVILVDDGSTDGTKEMIAQEFPQVRCIRQESNRGPAAARNLGIRVASGEIVAFTDDDCIVPPDWLYTLDKAFQDYPSAVAVSGIQEASEQWLQTYILARYERFVTRRIYGAGTEAIVGYPAPGGTNNLAVKRAALNEIGGFDEQFPVAAGEDADLLHRLTVTGRTTVCLPLSVVHYQRYQWYPFVSQQITRGIGEAYFLHKWGRLPPVYRDVLRLLLIPFLALRDVIRYKNFFMIGPRAVALGAQATGRLRARRIISSQQTPYVWHSAASPIKLDYLDRYVVGSTVLDIGAGQGFYTRKLLGRKLYVISVDPEPEALKDVSVVQAHLGALPFIKKFDTVLAFDVLEHETQEQRALENLRRVTGQRLILSVPNADDALLQQYNLTYKHHIDKTHCREYTAQELRVKLQKAGFHIVDLSYEGPISPALLSEFVRPKILQGPVRFLLKMGQRLGLLSNTRLMADIYVIAELRKDSAQ